MLVRSYKYRLYPTPTQVRRLFAMLRLSRLLYNHMLGYREEEHSSWALSRVRLHDFMKQRFARKLRYYAESAMANAKLCKTPQLRGAVVSSQISANPEQLEVCDATHSAGIEETPYLAETAAR